MSNLDDDAFRIGHKPRSPFGARHGVVRTDTFSYFPEDSIRKGSGFSDAIWDALAERRLKEKYSDRLEALQRRGVKEIDF